MMKNAFAKFGTGIFILALALGMFRMLQHPAVYRYSLGLITGNYVNKGDWNIVKEKVAYVHITDEGMSHWDAGHYKSIRDNGYDLQKGSKEWAYAFFPLFPWIWKVTALNSIGTGILNSLLFVISLILLAHVFIPDNTPARQKRMLYILALVLPGTVAYSIPYTESVFLFSFSIACFGLKRGMKWLFFLGFMLVGLTRPAVTILLFSMIASDIYFVFTSRKHLVKPAEAALRIIPLLLGTFLAMLVQHHFSGEWFKFMDIQSAWGDQHLQIPKKIGDWSEEGFGMSVFILLGVTLPVISCLAVTFFKKFKVPSAWIGDEKTNPTKYYIILSMFYCVGTSLFIVFFRGGLLNGLQRYVAATPMFYILFFSLSPALTQVKKTTKVVLLTALIITGTLFLAWSGYASAFSFADSGFYLFVMCAGLLLFWESWNVRLQYVLLTLLVLALIVWKTYLFNMFLSDAWIFT